MNNELSKKVRRFVADNAGYSLKEVSLDTTLLGDLGIDGDDAWDLIERFAKAFKVELDGLDLARHFHSEMELLCGPVEFAQIIWETLRGRARYDPDTSGKVPVSVRDLVESADQGKWRCA